MTGLDNPGTEFEARVASLLRSSPGYRNIREQQHIRGKNVDIVFQKPWNPHRSITIAIECKNWKSGLDRYRLQEIYLDYKPLLDASDVDEIWIVTPNPVAATVQEYADAFDGLEILHINEFEQDIIDFSIYVEHLAKRFSQDKLSEYYIPSRIADSGQTLHDKVCGWLTEANSEPIAVWAGYGMGKTSYATFLAAQLAQKFIADRSQRIPILIPLGDFYTAPRIDGLFANALTSEHGVHGYNFHTFWNLHEAGRFVIILDGFDEMKHAMTHSEFLAISREIRRLVLGNSKIILLGRPDAIVSDEEHAILIDGTRRISGFEVSDTNGSKFIECRLDFFSKQEYTEFLNRYLHAFYDRADKNTFIEKRLREVSRIDLSDILQRPVQARMLAQILLNPKNSIDHISKFELYTMFIEECLSRELEKHERKKTDSKMRREFMQDLAWWLWAVKRTRTFTVSDIPRTIRDKFITQSQDPLGQLREFLVGSVIEERAVGSILNEKDAGTFYFPHLSFTEFLVAEYLIERRLQEGDVRLLASALDGEIRSFLFSCKRVDALFKLYSDIRDHKLSFPWILIEFLAGSPTLRKQTKTLLEKEVRSVWQFAVEFTMLMSGEDAERAVSRCAGVVIASDQFNFSSVAVQLLARQLLILDPRSRLFELTANSLLSALFRGLNVDKLADGVRVRHVEYRTTSETEEFVVELMKEVTISSNETNFVFSTADVYKAILKATEGKAAITEQDTTFRDVAVKVSFAEVRKGLRTRHDRERFDTWLLNRRRVPVDCRVFE